MRPQDIFEGQLASQMVGTHNAAMECLKRATDAGCNGPSFEINLRLVAKFSALYLQQLDGSDRHHGKRAPQVNVGAVMSRPAVTGYRRQRGNQAAAKAKARRSESCGADTHIELGDPARLRLTGDLAGDSERIKQPVMGIR